ncbi:DUF3750 domain-containing protein [Aurantimonas sp. VKM B-3413]|uniref:DUF3750 domain-containing protein n=1 Tax=Aurantimonas sp. VKM B-3413 TaxID=2779401 RepID=UPI001E5DE544|nr:DUF3750 domain-containing protein [Aurantimonas sp. VKM B-3413]MCB8838814.1 DUF3750 domain-containing protein [Aurantimonas sp. VKM B-3413]
MRVLKLFFLIFLCVYLLPAIMSGAVWWLADRPLSWHQADWSSAALLPPPQADAEAAFYILAARTGGLKGAVADHSWIVMKSAGESRYERFDVVGWGMPVRRNSQPPDGRWYSNEPRIVFARRGSEAAAILPKVRAAIATYPFAMAGGYQIFPGPNSNTFTAFVMREVPEIDVALPPVAVGRDYPVGGRLVSIDPDGRDVRVSFWGYAGIAVGAKTGFELNLLGLVAGIDPARLGIKIPAFGAFSLLQS